MSRAPRSLCSPSAYKLLLNIFLQIIIFTNFDVISSRRTWMHQHAQQQQLTWSQRAAAEAEAVASLWCSGHGRAYLDGILLDDGRPICECEACFQGSQCSEFVPDCVADADSGDPLFLEPYWMQNAAKSAVLVSGWHRMSYSFPDHTSTSQALEKLIGKVHQVAKNAKTDGKYMLFGVGSTQLLNAAVFALSMNNTTTFSSPAKVVASAPYYSFYKKQMDFFSNENFEFAGDANVLKTSSHVIELVTSPNNPDGLLRKPVAQGSFVSTIYDHAYYWPHFTAIPAPSDEDVMIFTLSKLTGHAGSRFGWALIRDADVYEKMNSYISTAEMGISRDTQLRALQLLRALLEGDGRSIFDFAHEKMRIRWENLTRIISKSQRFSLQDISPQYCSFYQKVRGPSPAYAWLKCEKEEDIDCYEVLKAANITGREGTKFNADARYVRLSLLKRQGDFELLLYRLNELVSIKDGITTLQ